MGCERALDSPFDIDVTHGFTGCHGNLIQHHILCVPDNNAEEILLWFPWRHIDGRRNSVGFVEDVDPHVELALRDAGLHCSVEVPCLNVLGDKVLLAEKVEG